MSFSIAPGLLIAMPNLTDPNFLRSVVIVCAHDEEGAFGLVINMPTQLSMEAICEEAEVPWSGGDTQLAWRGGPVELQRGWLIHSTDRTFEGSQWVTDGVAVSSSQEALNAYGADPWGRFRLCLGYAGWGAGQLEEEIKQGGWLTAPCTSKLVFETEAVDVWAEAIRSVGVDPLSLVQAGNQLN